MAFLEIKAELNYFLLIVIRPYTMLNELPRALGQHITFPLGSRF